MLTPALAVAGVLSIVAASICATRRQRLNQAWATMLERPERDAATGLLTEDLGLRALAIDAERAVRLGYTQSCVTLNLDDVSMHVQEGRRLAPLLTGTPCDAAVLSDGTLLAWGPDPDLTDLLGTAGWTPASAARWVPGADCEADA